MADIKIYNFDTTNENLKNCPFCGGTPEWFLKGNDMTPSRTVVIKCPHCNVRLETSGRRWSAVEVAQHAMDKWNQRIGKSRW